MRGGSLTGVSAAAEKPSSPWSGYVIAYCLKKLAEVRKRDGLTQDEVAAKVGRTGAWLSTLKATGGIRLDTVAYVAQLLDIDLPKFVEAARVWSTSSVELYPDETPREPRQGVLERLEAVERSLRESGVVTKPVPEGPLQEVAVTPVRQPLRDVKDEGQEPRRAPKRASAITRDRQAAREGRTKRKARMR